MKQLLNATYRLFKVVYVLAIILSTSFLIGAIITENRPREIKVSETLHCYDGTTHTKMFFFESTFNETCGTELRRTINIFNPIKEVREDMTLSQYRILYPDDKTLDSFKPEGYSQHTITENFETEGSWRTTATYSFYALAGLVIFFGLIRWIFNYVVFGKKTI